MNFGLCLELALEEQELTYEQAGELFGFSKQRVGALVNQRNANTRTAERLAKQLGYALSEFIALGEK